jgi:hypothetical protein
MPVACRPRRHPDLGASAPKPIIVEHRGGVGGQCVGIDPVGVQADRSRDRPVDGGRAFVASSGLPFQPHAEFKKADLEQRRPAAAGQLPLADDAVDPLAELARKALAHGDCLARPDSTASPISVDMLCCPFAPVYTQDAIGEVETRPSTFGPSFPKRHA